MKYRVLYLVLLLVVCVASAAGAGTYTLSIPAASTMYFDFGRSFSTIESISITLSGHVTAGWYSGYGQSYPVGLRFRAILADGITPCAAAYTCYYGYYSYPNPESFVETSSFGSDGVHPNWPRWTPLLDGNGTVRISAEPDEYFGPDEQQYLRGGPTGGLDGSVSITLEGEAAPVPEPSSILFLGTGIFAIVPTVLRRRK